MSSNEKQLKTSLSDESIGDFDKENTEIQSLRFSDILFTSEEGLGLKFSMKPCLERKKVRELIERGGGHMSANCSEDCINLVTLNPNFGDNNQQIVHKYHYMTYVDDSCNANELLDLNNYLYQKTTTIEKSTDVEEEDISPHPMSTTRDIPCVEDDDQNTDSLEVDLNIDHNSVDNKSQNLVKSDINSDVSTAETTDEEVVEDNDEIIESNLKTNEAISADETDSQTETDEKNEDKCEEQKEEKNSEEMTSESDLDFDEESETTSKYFKPKDSKITLRKRLEPKGDKIYFNAYLDFMKQREETTTPENLHRIKQALKVSKNQPNRLNTHHSIRNKPKPKSSGSNTTFGAKILQKSMAEKRLKSTDSQESGYRVSDISSDECNEEKNEKSKETKTSLKIAKAIKHSINLKQSSLYCLSEDESILEFVLKSKRLDDLKGNSLWESAEKEVICEGRSWQSMKERFRKHIMPNIESYDITKREKQRLLQKQYFYSEKGSNKDNDSKGQTSLYTDEEDMYILNDIISKRGFKSVNGREFWQKMEKEFKNKKICDRSWQSMKERYRRRIVPNLFNYTIKLQFAEQMLEPMTGLTKNEKQIIYNKCQKTTENVEKRPTKRSLDLRQTPNNSENSGKSGSKVKKTSEKKDSFESQIMTRNRKRAKPN